MTYSELKQMIGQQFIVTFEHVQVNCTVLDGRSSFGRTDILVTPISGNGQQWVSLDRIKEIK